MRILAVVHQFLPKHFAGTELMAFLVADGLRSRGHEVVLLCAERDTGREAYSIRRTSYVGLPVEEVAYDNLFHDYSEMYADAEMTRAFARVLDEFRPELVHLQHTAFFGIEIIAEARRRAIPVVATLHDYYWICPRGTLMLEDLGLCDGPSPSSCGHCMRAFPLQPARYGCAPEDRASAWPRALAARRERFDARGAEIAAFVSPSQFLRGVFEAYGEPFRGRIAHIEAGLPGLPSSSAGRARGSRRIVFGYVGTIADYKGVAALVEAFRGLEGDELALEIHGELSWFPPFVARLRELAAGDPRISFLGAFDPHRSHEIHPRFDALVVPSLWYENAPVTIMEARREGLPVIATDLGGMREAVRDGADGLLFPRGDVAALRECLRRFAEDAALRARLTAGVRPPREASAMAADYERLFASTVSSSAP
ncbi:MAG: glycosyltransferase family 4 protein [Planctomycetes bacterium]|nr:glycosyltransferase family 4 protein [Planctomycetota bacterium]